MSASTASPGRAGRPIDRDDRRIQEDVLDELEWTPEVEAAGIGVSVRDGVVTLSGEARSGAEVAAARRAALRVRGTVAVADELRVRHSKWEPLSDAEIASVVGAALQGSAEIPRGSVHATVHDGVVTLDGEVPWHAQREAAVRLVVQLAGVRAVHSRIALTDRPASSETAVRIREALERSAAIDASRIDVTTRGTEVILDGAVRSAAEQQDAVRAAWASPSVTVVHDRLRIEPTDDRGPDD